MMISTSDKMLLRTAYRHMMRWTATPRIRKARFTLPSLEPSGKVDLLLRRCAHEAHGTDASTVSVRPRNATGARAAARAAFRRPLEADAALDAQFALEATTNGSTEAMASSDLGSSYEGSRVNSSEGGVDGRIDLAFAVLRALPKLGNAIEEQAQQAAKNAKRSPELHFRVGDIVHHKLFNYRGVVCGWDLRPVMDVANWSGVRATALREHQPFYTVLPDRTDLRQNGNDSPHERYCAQENLTLVKEPREARVRNKAMPVFFEAYMEPGTDGGTFSATATCVEGGAEAGDGAFEDRNLEFNGNSEVASSSSSSSSLEVGSFLPTEALLDLFPGDWPSERLVAAARASRQVALADTPSLEAAIAAAAEAEAETDNKVTSSATSSTNDFSINAAHRELASRRVVATMSQLQKELAEVFLSEEVHGASGTTITGWGDLNGAVMLRPGETHPTAPLAALLRGPSGALSAASLSGRGAAWADDVNNSTSEDRGEDEEDEARKWLYNGHISSSSAAQAEAQAWLSWVYDLSEEVQGLLAPHRSRQALRGPSSTEGGERGDEVGGAEAAGAAGAGAEFFVGQIVSHTKYDYRGLVIGWDPEAAFDVRGWDGLEHLWKANHDPTRRPFYRVLCDDDDEQRAFGAHRTVGVRYVAEANLKPAVQPALNHEASSRVGSSSSQSARSGLESAVEAVLPIPSSTSPSSSSSSSSWVSPVRSSHRTSYFAGFDPQKGACLPSAALRFSYPNRYASLAPGPAARLVAASSTASSAAAAAAGAATAGAATAGAATAGAATAGAATAGAATQEPASSLRAGLNSAFISENGHAANSSTAATTPAAAVGEAFDAESSAIASMVKQLEALDAMLQEKLATLGADNRTNSSSSNNSNTGSSHSNRSFKDDCSVLLRTAPGEQAARHAEDVLRLTSRAHGNEAVRRFMATAEHHENRREWALALESYRAAAEVAAGGVNDNDNDSSFSSSFPYVEAVARAASVHHLTGMHVEGAATANSVLKLDPTHVGAAAIEALCAEASLPSVGDPSVAFAAYARLTDMHPWSSLVPRYRKIRAMTEQLASVSNAQKNKDSQAATSNSGRNGDAASDGATKNDSTSEDGESSDAG